MGELNLDPKIEKMKVEDLPEVLAIEEVSFPTPFTENLFLMELDLAVAHLYVVKSQKKVLGYIDFWRVGPEVHVITLAVHPDYRKHQIASQLIAFMIDDGKKHKVEHISLDVRPSNAAGLALYRKFGFRQMGIRRAYYQNNQEDALVLNLDLKAENPQPSSEKAETK